MTTAQQLIDKVADGFQNKLNLMESARQLCIAAANAVAPRVSALEKPNRTALYWDPINGDDSNGGTSYNDSVKTFAGVVNAAHSNITLVRAYGNVDIDTRHHVVHDIDLEISGYNPDGSQNNNLTVNILDNNGSAGRPGGISSEKGWASVTFTRMHIHLNAVRDASGFLETQSLGRLRFTNCTFSKSADNVASLGWSYNSGILIAAFVASPPNTIAGNIFRFIADRKSVV